MKTNSKRILMILFTLLTLGAIGTGYYYYIIDGGDTSAVGDGRSRQRPQTESVAKPPTFVIVPTIGPVSSDPAFAAYAAARENEVRTTGTSPSSVGHIASPANGLVLKAGQSGNIVWWWLKVTAAEGETISLADINGKLMSSDPGNVLGRNISFVGRSYAHLAFGIKTDGTVVESGSSDQQVKTVVVGIGSQYFISSGPLDDQEIASILATLNWHMTLEVNASGGTKSVSLGLTPPVAPSEFSIKVTRLAGGQLKLEPTVAGTYKLQSATVPSGPYTDADMAPGTSFIVPSTTGNRFYRLLKP